MNSLPNIQGKKLLKERLDLPLEAKFETIDRLAKMYDKKLLKQRLHFPFHNKFETMDRLAKMHGEKNCWSTGYIFYFKTRVKLWIDWLKCTNIKLLKQRLDFSFENKIETMERFPKIQGQKIVETMVRFSIWKQV